MFELTSVPRVQFYLLKLDSELQYTITRPTKAPGQYDISDTDFEDADSEVKIDPDEDRTMRSRVDAIAVRLQIQVAKNDGNLVVEFEEGMMAMYALAVMQTDGTAIDHTGMQTDVPALRHAEMQTCPYVQQNGSTQTILGGQEIEPKYELKRMILDSLLLEGKRQKPESTDE
ncbi:hypothetical protein BCR34DRAFT_609450 [Clohesyomyces aquaticus]|uniref:Uncharacterized protein n=1 Tax=Clohesyomyces aquaticus TaxID=1231657 RepID=A0A1Y2ACP9_9PLEO|nr:hypothetical protein BCR34DRAFT_609450 [Clohesyomyces aquaticus]